MPLITTNDFILKNVGNNRAVKEFSVSCQACIAPAPAPAPGHGGYLCLLAWGRSLVSTRHSSVNGKSSSFCSYNEIYSADLSCSTCVLHGHNSISDMTAATMPYDSFVREWSGIGGPIQWSANPCTVHRRVQHWSLKLSPTCHTDAKSTSKKKYF